MGVSKNSGTPKSSILIGCSIINHPFWGTPSFGNTHIPKIPPKKTNMLNPKSWRWMEDVFPFQVGDFEVPAVDFPGSTLFFSGYLGNL